jgi:hypothetical protein
VAVEILRCAQDDGSFLCQYRSQNISKQRLVLMSEGVSMSGHVGGIQNT